VCLCVINHTANHLHDKTTVKQILAETDYKNIKGHDDNLLLIKYIKRNSSGINPIIYPSRKDANWWLKKSSA
jgi:hypothetical protein